mmetsp:Transcript_56608/g.104784  ORF Transcript_56608/g.104784 Transcript_56608/m.104784 type:complete len:140 (+) Transcript_56608:234-653(+)
MRGRTEGTAPPGRTGPRMTGGKPPASFAGRRGVPPATAEGATGRSFGTGALAPMTPAGTVPTALVGACGAAPAVPGIRGRFAAGSELGVAMLASGRFAAKSPAGATAPALAGVPSGLGSPALGAFGASRPAAFALAIAA